MILNLERRSKREKGVAVAAGNRINLSGYIDWKVFLRSCIVLLDVI